MTQASIRKDVFLSNGKEYVFTDLDGYTVSRFVEMFGMKKDAAVIRKKGVVFYIWSE